MTRIFALAAFLLSACLVSEAVADPFDTVPVTSVNFSGGSPLPAGTAVVFKAPTIFNVPGVVQAGYYNIAVPGPDFNDAGIYYYYPATDYTVFSGVATGGQLPPGGSITVSGYIWNQALVSWAIVFGDGVFNGTHLVTGTEP